MTTDTSQDAVQASTMQPRAGFPWRTTALVVGDAASFLLFAAIGRRTHAESSGIAAIGQIAQTALPFALGWFAVSPFAGAFRRLKTTGVVPMWRRTQLAWIIAWPLALALRWALAPDHNVPVSFAAVILVANALFLGVWRAAFALVERWRAR
jgi:DUF3054 family protein